MENKRSLSQKMSWYATVLEETIDRKPARQGFRTVEQFLPGNQWKCRSGIVSRNLETRFGGTSWFQNWKHDLVIWFWFCVFIGSPDQKANRDRSCLRNPGGTRNIFKKSCSLNCWLRELCESVFDHVSLGSVLWSCHLVDALYYYCISMPAIAQWIVSAPCRLQKKL